MSFAGFLKIFSSKTATTLNCSGLAAQPVHAVQLNVLAQLRRWLVRNTLTLIEFLPVACSGSKIEEEHKEHGSYEPFFMDFHLTLVPLLYPA